MDELYGFLQGRLRGALRLAVLGVGSVLRGDDAAGIMIVEKLMNAFPPGEYPNVRFYAGETAPENYCGKIASFSPSHLLVLDAADLGLEPGSIADIRPDDVGGPTFCSHLLPLKVMIDYIVGETGASVTLLGIQYKDLSFDGAMTPEMEEAVLEICACGERVIRALCSSAGAKL